MCLLFPSFSVDLYTSLPNEGVIPLEQALPPLPYVAFTYNNIYDGHFPHMSQSGLARSASLGNAP
jgi:hypothetical protein